MLSTDFKSAAFTNFATPATVRAIDVVTADAQDAH